MTKIILNDNAQGWIPVSVLLPWSAFENSVWGLKQPITKIGVSRAIKNGTYKLAPRPQDYEPFDLPPLRQARQFHTRRVAYLVVNRASDPIHFDANVGSYHFWSIIDGNHRLAAAIYREDEEIEVAVSGFLDLLPEIWCTDVQVGEDLFKWEKP